MASFKLTVMRSLFFFHSYIQVNAETAVQMIFRDASYILKKTLGCDMEQLQKGMFYLANSYNNIILLCWCIVIYITLTANSASARARMPACATVLMTIMI